MRIDREKHPLPPLLMPFILTLAIIVIDQITKAMIVRHVEPIMQRGYMVSVIGDFLRIINTQNTGITFSIGRDLPEGIRKVLFVALPLTVLTALIIYYFRTDEFTRPQRWAIAGIVGGGLGNQIDRIFRPAGVVDFIDFKFYGIFGLSRFPTFNVADLSITVSGIVLLVSVLFFERRAAGKLARRAQVNKKANTVIFMIGATLFNVLVMIIIFIAFFYLFGRFLSPVMSPQVGQIIIVVLFIGSIALTYFIYNRVVKWMSNKWNLDDYFDPIFSRRKKP